MILLRLRAGFRDDSGMSLVEMLVAMFISSFVLAGVAAMSISGLRTTASADVRNRATDQLRIAEDRMTKDLRTASAPAGVSAPFIVAEPERVAYYAQLDSVNLKAVNPGTQTLVPSVVWLWTKTTPGGQKTLCRQVFKATVVSGAFTWPPGATGTTTPTTCTPVIDKLVGATVRPTFTYLKATDTTTRPDGSSISTVTVNVAGAVPSANLPDIQSVEIWLTADLKERSSIKDPTMLSRVTLPNTL